MQRLKFKIFFSEASYPCLIAAGDYSSRLTVSNDGYRAIMACCNVVNETDSFLQSFAVIYGNGLIQITRPTLQNGTRETIYNAVLDGEDVWYSAPSNIFHTTLGANTSTLIFEGDILSIRSYDGNLYASNYDRLPYAIMQVGEGLPKELSEGTVFLNETATSVNGIRVHLEVPHYRQLSGRTLHLRQGHSRASLCERQHRRARSVRTVRNRRQNPCAIVPRDLRVLVQ